MLASLTAEPPLPALVTASGRDKLVGLSCTSGWGVPSAGEGLKWVAAIRLAVAYQSGRAPVVDSPSAYMALQSVNACALLRKTGAEEEFRYVYCKTAVVDKHSEVC